MTNTKGKTMISDKALKLAAVVLGHDCPRALALSSGRIEATCYAVDAAGECEITDTIDATVSALRDWLGY